MWKEYFVASNIKVIVEHLIRLGWKDYFVWSNLKLMLRLESILISFDFIVIWSALSSTLLQRKKREYGSSGQGMNEHCMQANIWSCVCICVHCGEFVCTSVHTRCVCLCVWPNNYTFSRVGSPMQRCQPRMHREVMSQLQFSQLSNLSR